MNGTARGLLLWEAFLTFISIVASGIGVIGVVGVKPAAFGVLIAQALNAATIVYKFGTWSPNPGVVPAQPMIVVQGQSTQPPE